MERGHCAIGLSGVLHRGSSVVKGKPCRVEGDASDLLRTSSSTAQKIPCPVVSCPLGIRCATGETLFQPNRYSLIRFRRVLVSNRARQSSPFARLVLRYHELPKDRQGRPRVVSRIVSLELVGHRVSSILGHAETSQAFHPTVGIKQRNPELGYSVAELDLFLLSVVSRVERLSVEEVSAFAFGIEVLRFALWSREGRGMEKGDSRETEEFERFEIGAMVVQEEEHRIRGGKELGGKEPRE